MFCSVKDLCQLVFSNEAVWPNGQGARLRIWRLQVRVLPRSTIFQKIASNNKQGISDVGGSIHLGAIQEEIFPLIKQKLTLKHVY